MTAFSNYSPTVTVYDDGRVEIDWFDCYIDSHETDNAPEAEGRHTEILDDLVAYDGATPADGLRKLADYIDARS